MATFEQASEEARSMLSPGTIKALGLTKALKACGERLAAIGWSTEKLAAESKNRMHAKIRAMHDKQYPSNP